MEMQRSLQKLRDATHQNWVYDDTGGGHDCFSLTHESGYYLLTNESCMAPVGEDWEAILTLGWYPNIGGEWSDIGEILAVETMAELTEWAEDFR